MRRYILLLALLFVCLFAQAALADCYSYTVIVYQTTEWWDGTITYQILDMYEVGFCDVSGGVPPDNTGGGGYVPPPTSAPSVNLAFVDTTDVWNPIVGVDVSSNDSTDQVAWVIFEINGTTQDYIGYVGNGRYQLHMPAITTWGEGTQSLNGKACTGQGICGESGANLNRFNQNPSTNGEDMSAAWQEEDPEGPVTRYGAYGHSIRQMYMTTWFSCSELGGNSHVEVKDSLVTISSVYPEPMWNGSVQSNGTINNASWGLSYNPDNPVGCTFPTVCWSKSGGAWGAFGYAPSVDDSVGSFVIEGASAMMTGGSLHVTF